MKDAKAERLLRTGLGALAGLSVWAAIETWGAAMSLADLFLTMLAVVFFGALLLLFRRGQARQSVLHAAVIAVPVAGLMASASLRYNETFGVIEAASPLVVAFFLAALPIPFLISMQRADGDWRHYPTLFTVSWALALKSLAALLFVGIVWAVMMLSAALLLLVGIGFLERLLHEHVVIWLLNGVAFGLGLAVLGELADIVVPRPVLRLLRLFLPVMVVVEALFLLGLPFRGLGELFGGRSTAGVLMAIAIGAIGLISIAVAEADSEAVQGRFQRLAARVLAMLLPLIAALAAWAIWLRVRDYGWTPDRIAAALGAALVAGYAICYAVAVLRGDGWMARLRRANVAMALALILLGVLWLSPVFDAGAISVRSQIARYQAGAARLDQLPVRKILMDWGRTGPQALDRLRAEAPDADRARLADAISAAEADRYGLTKTLQQGGNNARLGDLAARAIILPEGAALPDWLGEGQPGGKLAGWLSDCGRAPAPGLPGCAFVIADFVSAIPGEEVMVFLNKDVAARSGQQVEQFIEIWNPDNDGHPITLYPMPGGRALSPRTVFSALASGNYRIGPANLRALFIDGVEFGVTP